jgi:hypothetical protein
MAEMTPFEYAGFYDVPRCILISYRERRFLLESSFNEDLDDYETSYSVYSVPELAPDSLRDNTGNFFSTPSMLCVGHIRVEDVLFDPSKRKLLDASILDSLVAEGG